MPFSFSSALHLSPIRKLPPRSFEFTLLCLWKYDHNVPSSWFFIFQRSEDMLPSTISSSFFRIAFSEELYSRS
jgi:hypothetical protein